MGKLNHFDLLLAVLRVAFLFSAVAARGESQDSTTATSPDKKHFAATRRTPDDEYIWKPDLDYTRLVIFTLKRGDELERIYARREIGGRLVAQLRWSPDSKYLVITTTSSGGHSPYHFKAYVFCVADRSLRYMDDVTDTVLAPDFSFEPPDIAVMTVADRAHELFEPGDRKTIKVPLHEAVKRMKRE
jgi:hypothetical protein